MTVVCASSEAVHVLHSVLWSIVVACKRQCCQYMHSPKADAHQALSFAATAATNLIVSNQHLIEFAFKAAAYTNIVPLVASLLPPTLTHGLTR